MLPTHVSAAQHVTLIADLRALGFNAQRSLGIPPPSQCLEHVLSNA